MIELIEPAWNAPPAVRACFTTRRGGVSQAPYDDFNLALHVGDARDHVLHNRARLVDTLALEREPEWINQTHGIQVVDLDNDAARDGDAAVCRAPGRVAAVLVADCLPILLCNRAGNEVAAVHAGWRGLLAGVVGAALDAMQSPARELLAWIGPGISQAHFEVGDEVRAAYAAALPGSEACFAENRPGHWLCDLAGIAADVLETAGVTSVTRAPHCSYRERELFYSYRRDGVSGRMAGLIWIKD
ncbi:MAG: peptidoglycan editing factor PgeF [Gammaproteobacteria bacterium]|nr:peptidoglycan editing factor PgeF [Gammaproteobacteria bacterium]